ncbi:MAG TPA: hypothetical protein VFT48_00395, partial [Pyrinomonadaceae bacterium]|nr:hypothetical protein [Pyrinomonadaceae bacterium]
CVCTTDVREISVWLRNTAQPQPQHSKKLTKNSWYRLCNQRARARNVMAKVILGGGFGGVVAPNAPPNDSAMSI